jgi:hypothetical protein
VIKAENARAVSMPTPVCFFNLECPFGSKADIEALPTDVRFTPKADINQHGDNVRVVPRADISGLLGQR